MAQLGLRCKFYINTGTYAVPVWSEVKKIKDFASTIDPKLGDASCRGDEFEMSLAGQNALGLSGSMVYDSSDPNFILIRDAVWANTDAGKTLEVAVMDKDIATSGSQGLRLAVVVSQFGNEQPMGESVTIPLAFKPTPSDNPPAWYIVA